MAICFFVLGLILCIRHKPAYKFFGMVSLAFLFLGQFAPVILKPIYHIWMALAFCLGWINTRIILIVIFYLLLSPIGLLAKLLRKDFLDLRIERQRVSYWKKREGKDMAKERYERIF